jgi:hypothetical protein
VAPPPVDVPAAGFRRLEIVIGAAVAVIACAAATGPGWLAGAEHATSARLGQPLAWAPGHGALARLAAILPIGEVGFRVSLVSAIAAGALAAGVIAMIRALVAREVGAGLGAVVALAMVGAIRVAATSPGPAMLTAAGVAWAVAGVIAMRRGAGGKDDRGAAPAIAGVSVALAASPWIGIALALVVGPLVYRRRRALLAVPVLTLAPLIAVAGVPPLVADPFGRIPAVLGALGSDAGVIVLGAGVLGLGFGAATGLRGAAAALLAVLLVAFGGACSPVAPAEVAVAILPVLALGIGVLATAGIRIAAGSLDGTRRAAAAAALSLAFPALAITTVAAPRAPDADAPARAAADLAAAAPPGPGAVFAGGDALVTALRHERVVAGLRPDLALGLRVAGADEVAVRLMRSAQIVAADVPVFGALDARFARPRGRGFELLLIQGASDAVPDPPANYPGAIGREIASRLALSRALWEAGAGQLERAARAAGLAGTRFDAGAIAVLAARTPTAERPPLFGFVPELGSTDARVWLDLFGDDLAWVGGMTEPPLPPEAPPERRLHARWRAVLAGIAPPNDPAIRAFGRDAVRATREMLTATGHPDAADKLAP